MEKVEQGKGDRDSWRGGLNCKRGRLRVHFNEDEAFEQKPEGGADICGMSILGRVSTSRGPRGNGPGVLKTEQRSQPGRSRVSDGETARG